MNVERAIGGAHLAAAEVVGKNCAHGGDRGRVRTALARRYAHAQGEGAYRAPFEVILRRRVCALLGDAGAGRGDPGRV